MVVPTPATAIPSKAEESQVHTASRSLGPKLLPPIPTQVQIPTRDCSIPMRGGHTAIEYPNLPSPHSFQAKPRNLKSLSKDTPEGPPSYPPAPRTHPAQATDTWPLRRRAATAYHVLRRNPSSPSPLARRPSQCLKMAQNVSQKKTAISPNSVKGARHQSPYGQWRQPPVPEQARAPTKRHSRAGGNLTLRPRHQP